MRCGPVPRRRRAVRLRGRVVRKPGPRVLGLPVNTALIVGGVLVALLILAGLVIPSAGRRMRARGGGTYGR